MKANHSHKNHPLSIVLWKYSWHVDLILHVKHTQQSVAETNLLIIFSLLDKHQQAAPLPFPMSQCSYSLWCPHPSISVHQCPAYIQCLQWHPVICQLAGITNPQCPSRSQQSLMWDVPPVGQPRPDCFTVTLHSPKDLPLRLCKVLSVASEKWWEFLPATQTYNALQLTQNVMNL